MTNKDWVFKCLENKIEDYKQLPVEDFAKKFHLIAGTNAYNFPILTGK